MFFLKLNYLNQNSFFIFNLKNIIFFYEYRIYINFWFVKNNVLLGVVYIFF
jgi:hypothetical protein